MLNKFGRFDPHFNDGVVSIKIDADGVACKDDDLISHIENTFRGIEPYLKHLDSAKIIEISSFTTDAGGGGGTKETCAFKYRDSFGRIYHIMYVITCALHGHSKPLEKAWLSAFSKFGLGEKNVGQFVYECWYIQDRLGEKFKQRWELITGKKWVGILLPKPILSRWGYPMLGCTKVYEHFDDWGKFIQHHYEVEKAANVLAKTSVTCLALWKNPEVKCHLSFIVHFGKEYWTPGYNWMRMKDEITKHEGHCSHEMLQQVFVMLSKLDEIISSWESMPVFAECTQLVNALDDDILDDDGKVTKPGKQSTKVRFILFLNNYRKAFLKDSGFQRWFTTLCTFTLGSSNAKATTIFAQHILRLRSNSATNTNSSPMQSSFPTILPSGVSHEKAHSSYEYSNWLLFLETYTKIDLKDPLLKYEKAIELLAEGEKLWECEDDEMQKLRTEIENVVLPSKHHGQEAEQGVQEVSICAANQKAEKVASALVSVRSYDNQYVTQEEKKRLACPATKRRSNQHIIYGPSNDDVQYVSEEAKQLQKERNASHFERVSRPQAGSNRAKLVIRRANIDPIPPEMYQFMMEQIQDVMTKSNGREAAKDIRLNQDKQHLEERQQDYDARKSGRKKAKFREGAQLEPSVVTRANAMTGKMKIGQFTRTNQRTYLIKELTARNIAFRKNDGIKKLREIMMAALGTTSKDFELELIAVGNKAGDILELVS